MLFSQRKKLAEDFEKWRHENEVADSPLNVITYLNSVGKLRSDNSDYAVQHTASLKCSHVTGVTLYVKNVVQFQDSCCEHFA